MGHDRMVTAAVVAVVSALMLTCAACDLIKVGGKDGWKPNVDYTHWAAHRHFYVGDWLYFGFDKHRYSVLEVTKKNYEKCSDEDFVTNITRGGRDVFNLTEAKAYYFLSSGGYCFEGMKLSVHVHRLSSDSPSSDDRKNEDDRSGAYSESKPDFFLLLTMTAAALSTFIFKLS